MNLDTEDPKSGLPVHSPYDAEERWHTPQPTQLLIVLCEAGLREDSRCMAGRQVLAGSSRELKQCWWLSPQAPTWGAAGMPMHGMPHINTFSLIKVFDKAGCLVRRL